MFDGVLNGAHGCLKEVQWVLEANIKGVSRMFRGRFKGVSRKIEGCFFKGDSREL